MRAKQPLRLKARGWGEKINGPGGAGVKSSYGSDGLGAGPGSAGLESGSGRTGIETTPGRIGTALRPDGGDFSGERRKYRTCSRKGLKRGRDGTRLR